jgi:hypothetical protein
LRILASGVNVALTDADNCNADGFQTAPGVSCHGDVGWTSLEKKGQVEMAKQFVKTGKRLGVWAASAILLASVGCAFPHGRYGGDPMLGNFNRPIAQTPPVWGGGDPGHTPAYDGGAHLGQSPPYVPTSTGPAKEKLLIVPTFSGSLGLGGMFHSGGSSKATSTESNSTPVNGENTSSLMKPGNPVGAKLPLETTSKASYATMYGAKQNADSVSFRTHESGAMLTSGANIEPYVPRKKVSIPIDLTKDPASIASVEEGQSVLTTCGARQQKLEQDPTGEWRYMCTMGANGEIRRYEARGNDQIEAMRAVMYQIQKDK